MIGSVLSGKIYLPITDFIMFVLNSLMVIIIYCSIYNLINMLCSEVVVSMLMSIIVFIAMFVIEASVGYIANSPKYSTHSYLEDGIEYIISQEPNPNYCRLSSSF